MWGNKSDKEKIPFIVNEGTIYDKHHILRVLSTLESVAYFEIVDKKVVNRGEGQVLRVCLSSEDPTLFLKGMIHINVNSFNYLQVKNLSGRTVFELHSDKRVIKLIPIERPRTVSAEEDDFMRKLSNLGIASKEDFKDLDDQIFLSDEWFNN